MIKFFRNKAKAKPDSEVMGNKDLRLSDLKKSPVFNFRVKRSDSEMVDRGITYDEATMSIIAFGTTGSGKTATVMRPILKNLTRDGCGGLVLDIKGDYSSFLLSECDESRLVLVGEGLKTNPVNIISGMSAEQFRGFLGTISMGNGSGRDGFWGTGGIRDAMLIFSFVIAKYDRNATLSEIYQYLNNPQFFCQEFDKFIFDENLPEVPDYLDRCIEPCVTEDFSILKVGFSRLIGGKENKDSRDLQQYTWHTQMLKSQLRPFYENEKLELMFCHKGDTVSDVSFYEMAVSGKVVCLNLNYARYGGAAKLISKIVKSRYYSDVFDSEPEVIKERLDGKYTFLLIDEYQDYIVADSGSLGLMIDDNSFFDKSRAYGHINVLSTQGVSSLLAKTESKFVVDSILQNIRTRIVLPTPDKDTISLIGGGELLNRPLERGQGDPEFVIHKHANSSSDAYLETGYSKGFIDGGSSTFSWKESMFSEEVMPEKRQGRMVSTKKYREMEKDIEAYKTSYDDLVDFPDDPFLRPVEGEIDLIYRLNKSIEYADSKRLNIIICPETSLVLEDFCRAFDRRWKEIVRISDSVSGQNSLGNEELINSIELAKEEDAKSQFLFFPVPRGYEETKFKETLKSAIRASQVTKVSTITVIRGGGDSLNETYSICGDLGFSILTAKEESDVKLCVSIGHAKDNPDLQKCADISATTPTHLGSKMADYILEKDYNLSLNSLLSLPDESDSNDQMSVLENRSDDDVNEYDFDEIEQIIVEE